MSSESELNNTKYNYWEVFMKNILIHGLGQNNKSWDKVEKFLTDDIKTEQPNLYEMMENKEFNYDSLYNQFADYCNSFDEKLNLCGLSLGGILALDYAKHYPDKVNSLTLIGVPYQIPKTLFKIQNFIFYLMPRGTFEKMGVSKKDFISLVKSMENLEIAGNISELQCKTLILCGEKDKTNMKSAKQFHQKIKNSNFKIICKSSHEVNLDNPKELSVALVEFWRR